MQFGSLVFIFVFLPAALAAYYIVPFRRFRNYVLLFASLAFYAWGDPGNLTLLTVTIVANYSLIVLMSRLRTQQARRTLMGVTVVGDILVLFIFKYTDFIISNIDSAFGCSFVVPALALPLGVSYYVLKLITYAVDVYRGKAPAQSNLVDLALYASMFPAMTAGPIVKYQTIQAQLHERTHSLNKVAGGMRLFCIGLAKKVLLSNNVAILASTMLSYGGETIGVVGAWSGLVAFAFQLYFDFSGYSDMAIGLARMFGFDFEKNFNYPYISRSVTEFWRRWHISLSTFFREYVYIPMGGSRVKTPRFILNMATVWVLTGVWHGAAWNYVWWGIYYLGVLLFEKFILNRFIEKVPNMLRHIYVVFVFLVGWCFFWIGDTNQLFGYLRALFGAYGFFGNMTYWQIGAWQYLVLLIVCAIASTPIVPLGREVLCRLVGEVRLRGAQVSGCGIKDVEAYSLCDFDRIVLTSVASTRGLILLKIALLGCDLLLFALMGLSILSIVSGSFAPAIYAVF